MQSWFLGVNQPDLYAFLQQGGNQCKEWLVINVQVFDVCRSNPHCLLGLTYQ